MDSNDLAKALEDESKANNHLRADLDRHNDNLRHSNNLHMNQLDKLKQLEAQYRSSRSSVDALNLTTQDREHEHRCLQGDLIEQDKEILSLRESLARLNGDVDHMNHFVAQATNDHNALSRLLDQDRVRNGEVKKVVDGNDLQL